MMRAATFMLMVVSTFFLALGGCLHELPVGHRPSHLSTVCLRTVDDEGFLRGRTVQFASNRIPDFSGRLRYSHRGACVSGAQGEPRRILVCLVGSSPCHHDRTTTVWDDQLDRYFERYPGSYRGECTSECSTHEDDCVEKANEFRGISDWYQWMRDMEAIKRRERYQQ